MDYYELLWIIEGALEALHFLDNSNAHSGLRRHLCFIRIVPHSPRKKNP